MVRMKSLLTVGFIVSSRLRLWRELRYERETMNRARIHFFNSAVTIFKMH